MFQARPHLHVFPKNNASPHTARLSMQFIAANALTTVLHLAPASSGGHTRLLTSI